MGWSRSWTGRGSTDITRTPSAPATVSLTSRHPSPLVRPQPHPDLSRTLSLAMTSLPLSSSTFKQATWPLNAALCRAVNPLWKITTGQSEEGKRGVRKEVVGGVGSIVDGSWIDRHHSKPLPPHHSVAHVTPSLVTRTPSPPP